MDHHTTHQIIKPSSQFVGRGDDTERLYGLERLRNDTILKCAVEWSAICGVSDVEHWTRAVPQALFDTLSSFGPRYAIAAAVAFLETAGYTVTSPDEEGAP